MGPLEPLRGKKGNVRVRRRVRVIRQVSGHLEVLPRKKVR